MLCKFLTPRRPGVRREGATKTAGTERGNPCSLLPDLLLVPEAKTGAAVCGRLCPGIGGVCGEVEPASPRAPQWPESGALKARVCLPLRHTKAGSGPVTTWQGALSRIPEAPCLSGSPGLKDIWMIPNARTRLTGHVFHARGSKMNKRKKKKNRTQIQQLIYAREIEFKICPGVFQLRACSTADYRADSPRG